LEEQTLQQQAQFDLIPLKKEGYICTVLIKSFCHCAEKEA
jgi:hypothetical protein